MKRLMIALCCVLLLTVLVAPSVAAVVPYTTYTYDIEGNMVQSPHAYVPYDEINSAKIGLEKPLNTVKDLFVDDEGMVYLADSGNNRIVILDSEYTLVGIINAFVNDEGVPDSLETPSGVYITHTEIFVADTDNNRICIFDRYPDENGEYAFHRIVNEPESDVFPEGHVYKPIALVVDNAGRIYVISSTTHYGVIAMNSDGKFNGFLGAQKTSPSLWDIFWRNFQTAEQRRRSVSYVPTEYNNISIDESGFIYVTTSTINKINQQGSIRSKSSAYAPVKKLNPEGEDVMMRTGFFAPHGEVNINFQNMEGDAIAEASTIVDVALGPNGTWSIADQLRGKVFTYDEQGNLLYVFGDKIQSALLGGIDTIVSMIYKGTDLLVFDKTIESFTIYKRTEYGDLIAAALQNQRDRNYSEAVSFWRKILQSNSNFDQAYVGIGDSLYRAGKYEEAMEQYKYAHATQNYSNAFRNVRKAWLEKYIIIVPIVLIVFFWLLSKFLKYAGAVNEKGQVTKEKRSWKEATLYGFHVMMHPFDGFWDLKHEKRGNIRGAMTILAFTIVAVIYKSLGTAYVFDPKNMGVSFISQILAVLVPYLLWCVANWCLTTLFDGEGSFKDIVIATAYALLPLPLFIIPTTVITNFLTLDESSIVTLLFYIGYIWCGFLVFFGAMVTHDYSLSKNILTSLGTMVGIAFIMFIGVLFSGLLAKVFSFVYNLVVELALRL